MLKLLSFAGALLFAASTAVADIAPPPAVTPPDVFVKSLYDTKLESEAVSADLGRAVTDSLILTNFSADLLALYKSTYYIDEPVIDGDVFMMAQEWEPTDVATRTTAQTPEAATVEATFKIGAETRTVTYTLKALRNGWEIDDIASPQGSIRKWIADYKP
ncbi:MAG: hypothetical protein QM698_16875 [Micropepsaceae bacterium]